jgi:hypothetical protein
MNYENRRGFLVPVANPEGVAALIAIAVAASEPDEPPPQVVAFVPRVDDRRSRSSASDPVEIPSALQAAIEYAGANRATIGARAIWSENPAIDIIEAAQAASAAWILLGYHRVAAGSDPMGGVVHQVFEQARELPINVGVFVQGTDLPFDRIYSVYDSRPDGQASLALAARIAHKSKSKLRALVASDQQRDENDLSDMLIKERSRMGSLLHTDVLSERSLKQLFRQAPGRLLILGKKFADEVRLPLDEAPEGDRCVIVVQGARIDVGKQSGSS